MAEIFARRTGLPAGDRELWWIDPEAAVAAELAAALNVTAGLALHQTHRGVALRDRLPNVAALFEAGVISEILVRAIVWRTYLINDALDVESDRKHPTKCKRPIAAGEMSVQLAYVLAVVLLVAGVGIAFATSYESFLIFRLAIGAIGASFVITQFHTSVMFAPNVVGTANATGPRPPVSAAVAVT